MSTTALATPRDPQWVALAWLLLATFLTAAIGAFASIDAKEFYASLNQPAWSPPPTVFGPVWTVLYLMMCAAAWLVVRQVGTATARPAMWLYGTQLVCNALWTWLFFHWHWGAVAFAEVLLLFVLVTLTLRAFWRVRALSGWLLLPYLAWVGFASALTLAMWRLNPGVL
ncbi:MAG: TspO/MBR family protein [Burkholderiales bacterium]|nr:TspO/MBR family protein [Burkholderiales bacterium]